MIQINLLPDVKREFLKAQQMKRMFIVVSLIITVAAVAGLVILFVFVRFGQPRHVKNLQSDIDQSVSQLKQTKDAVKIVTVQGVLEQIPGLQDKEAATSRTFGYITSFTPQGVSYSEVKLDLSENIITLSGQSDSLEQANVLANNLKSAKFVYKKDSQKQTSIPFKSVVFSSLGKIDQATDDGKNVTFELSFSFEPTLFDESVKEPAIAVNGASEPLLLPTDKPFSDSNTSGAQQ